MQNLEEIAEQYRGGTVVIVGNGPSLVTMPGPAASFQRYIEFHRQKENGGAIKDINDFEQAKALVNRIDNSPFPLWTINGAWVYHPKSTLGFQMDDFKFHRHETHPQAEWYNGIVKDSGIPVMSPKVYPEFKNLVEFPIREVIKKYKTIYFGETVDYMVALAGLFEVKKIIFMGCDYQVNDRFPAERAGTEYWIGKVEKSETNPDGVEIDHSRSQNLMKPSAWESHFDPRFYGYANGDFPLSDHEILCLIRGEEYQAGVRRMADYHKGRRRVYGEERESKQQNVA